MCGLSENEGVVKAIDGAESEGPDRSGMKLRDAAVDIDTVVGVEVDADACTDASGRDWDVSGYQ